MSGRQVEGERVWTFSARCPTHPEQMLFLDTKNANLTTDEWWQWTGVQCPECKEMARSYTIQVKPTGPDDEYTVSATGANPEGP